MEIRVYYEDTDCGGVVYYANDLKYFERAQFRVLAGLGHDMGHTYVKQWTNMKPLLDAAGHAVLGHGFDTIKAERFHQLHEIVVKLTGVNDLSLPKFPVLNL